MSKRFSALGILLIVVMLMAACTPPAPQTPAATQPPAVDTKGLTEAQIKWAQANEIGPFEKTQDWAAIEAAAVKEGKVVVYSASSRIKDIAASFEKQYPGIKVEGYDIATADLLTKVIQEQKAGVYTADVIFSGDYVTQYNEMIDPPTKMLWKFVPKELEAVLPAEARDKLMVHHYEMSLWIYNNEVYKESPIKNIWDLTKPEWKGKVVLNDPQKGAGNLNAIASLVQKPELMAAAYKEAFGKDIVLEAGVPNAAYQWIKDLLKNDPVLTSSSGDAATAVGTKAQKNPPVGLAASGKLRNAASGDLVFAGAWDLKPFGGVIQPFMVSISNQSTHPNAAKLMIKWMMGDKAGGQGYTPFYVPGDFNPRTDVPPVAGMKPFSEIQKNTWMVDVAFVYKNAIQVRDFWVANLTKK